MLKESPYADALKQLRIQVKKPRLKRRHCYAGVDYCVQVCIIDGVLMAANHVFAIFK